MKPNARHCEKGRLWVADQAPNIHTAAAGYAHGFFHAEQARSHSMMEDAMRLLEKGDWKDADGTDFTPAARKIAEVLRERWS